MERGAELNRLGRRIHDAFSHRPTVPSKAFSSTVEEKAFLFAFGARERSTAARTSIFLDFIVDRAVQFCGEASLPSRATTAGQPIIAQWKRPAERTLSGARR